MKSKIANINKIEGEELVFFIKHIYNTII